MNVCDTSSVNNFEIPFYLYIYSNPNWKTLTLIPKAYTIIDMKVKIKCGFEKLSLS